MTPEQPGIPARWFVLRVLLVALALVLVFCTGELGSAFFYQGF